MPNTNNFIFTALKIISWVIFVGLCIEAGALLVNFIFSLFKPDFVQNLYQKLDLGAMYARSKWAYFGMYSYILAIAILKVVLFYAVIILVSKIDLNQPFNRFVAGQISSLSYYAFSIGIVSFLAKQTANYLEHRDYTVDSLNQFFEDGQAFILMGAVIYIIATIFSRGVELQTENDLTI